MHRRTAHSDASSDPATSVSPAFFFTSGNLAHLTCLPAGCFVLLLIYFILFLIIAWRPNISGSTGPICNKLSGYVDLWVHIVILIFVF